MISFMTNSDDNLSPWLWRQINSSLAALWPRLFGYHLLAIGPWAEQLNFSGSPIRHRCLVNGQSAVNGHSGVVAAAEALPFAEHSVDLVVLPFSLHHSRDPQQLMREAYRVLIPGGHLLIIQPNPWGVALAMPWLAKRRQHPLWQGCWLSPWRLHEWLSLLACDIRQQQHLAFTSGWSQQPPVDWFEQQGRRWLAPLAAVELIVACKQEAPLTLIRMPQRSGRRAARPALAPQARV